MLQIFPLMKVKLISSLQGLADLPVEFWLKLLRVQGCAEQHGVADIAHIQVHVLQERQGQGPILLLRQDAVLTLMIQQGLPPVCSLLCLVAVGGQRSLQQMQQQQQLRI